MSASNRRKSKAPDRARRPGPPANYRPHGGVPYPTLADGVMYLPDMTVTLKRTVAHPDYPEGLEMEWEGRLLSTTWLEDAEWVHPDKRNPDRGRWKATADWGSTGRPEAPVWVDELTWRVP